ncbi:MAG: hypothetical protein QOD06_2283 [Candidatus Binatota bacterium]|jgi:prepilin-type N-terminal cleavage/methylation domain-containing protein|nr:hypothetical protein [Candidatus Binatota bacterium]
MMRRSRGFTLLEITITLAILGVVLVVVYGVFAQTLASKEHVETKVELSSTARVVLDRIIRDLEGAVGRLELRPAAVAASSAAPPPTPTPAAPGAAGVVPPQSAPELLFVARDHTEGSVPFDELAFSAFVPRATGRGTAATDLATIHYFVVPNEEHPASRALYREAQSSLAGVAFDAERPDPGQTALLLDHIAGLRFRFFDGKEWVEEWDSNDGRRYAKMPLGVEITLLVWSDDEQVESYHTAVDLPMAAELGRGPQVARAPEESDFPENENEPDDGDDG